MSREAISFASSSIPHGTIEEALKSFPVCALVEPFGSQVNPVELQNAIDIEAYSQKDNPNREEFMEFPSNMPDFGHRFYLIDSTAISLSCGFAQFLTQNLPSALFPDLTDFAVAEFSDSLVFLSPSSKEIVYPALESMLVSPSTFFSSVPNSLHFRTTSTQRSEISFTSMIEFAAKSAGNYGEVTIFLSHTPSEFVDQTFSDSFDLKDLKRQNLPPQIEALKNIVSNLNISLSIIALQNSVSESAFPFLFNFSLAVHARLISLPASLSLQNLTESVRVFSYAGKVKISKSGSLSPSVGPFNLQPEFFTALSSEKLVFPFSTKKSSSTYVSLFASATYRTPSGKMMTRVARSSVELSSSADSIFNSANYEPIIRYYTHKAIQRFLELDVSSKALIADFSRTFIPLLISYHERVLKQHPSPASFTIPPSFNLIPTQILGFLKSQIFSFGIQQSQRASAMLSVPNLSYYNFESLCHPRVNDITDFIFGGNEGPQIPPRLSSFVHGRVYRLYDGVDDWIFIPEKADPKILESLFGRPDPDPLNLQESDSAPMRRLASATKGRRVFCFEKSYRHQIFIDRLVEDDTTNLFSLGKWVEVLRYYCANPKELLGK